VQGVRFSLSLAFHLSTVLTRRPAHSVDQAGKLGKHSHIADPMESLITRYVLPPYPSFLFVTDACFSPIFSQMAPTRPFCAQSRSPRTSSEDPHSELSNGEHLNPHRARSKPRGYRREAQATPQAMLRRAQYEELSRHRHQSRCGLGSSFSSSFSPFSPAYYRPSPFQQWLGDLTSPYVSAMASCITSQWGISPLYIREGGSIPSLPFLEREFGADAVHFPMGTSSDSAHLPDERIRILNLEVRFLCLPFFLSFLASKDFLAHRSSSRTLAERQSHRRKVAYDARLSRGLIY
jgi:hypothetical protein